uniref:Uncharacterized protein n=1 Tax=Rhizophora mucronata TaxID=61149 RepID=A0A2P2NR41_RHIMU
MIINTFINGYCLGFY